MNQDINTRLMFLAAKKFESNKATRGAFLLTDLNTKPIEFRCTNPIRPTQLQTMLYGDSLEQHIMVELIGIPLINSLKDRPQLILVMDKVFLGIRLRTEIPVILISKEEKMPVEDVLEDSTGHLLHSSTGRFEPVVIVPHAKFSSDREQAKTTLCKVFENYDVSEPFNRISLALDQVHAEKIGEGK